MPSHTRDTLTNLMRATDLRAQTPSRIGHRRRRGAKLAGWWDLKLSQGLCKVVELA